MKVAFCPSMPCDVSVIKSLSPSLLVHILPHHLALLSFLSFTLFAHVCTWDAAIFAAVTPTRDRYTFPLSAFSSVSSIKYHGKDWSTSVASMIASSMLRSSFNSPVVPLVCRPRDWVALLSFFLSSSFSFALLFFFLPPLLLLSLPLDSTACKLRHPCPCVAFHLLYKECPMIQRLE